jgi:predicted PurR-regulated permease PerM
MAMDQRKMAAAIDEIAAFAKRTLAQAPQSPTKPNAEDVNDDNLAMRFDGDTCKVMTIRHRQNLQAAFEMFDEDRSGELSQGEIIKLLLRLSVVGNQEDAIKVMREMDENNDGSIDLREFLDGMDDIAAVGKYIHREEFEERMSKKLKLGFAGTSWLQHASITWMMNAGVMIITTAVMLTGLIYFRFVLVPLSMAYFLTFLLGPLMDYIYQRPLVTCLAGRCVCPGQGEVCCPVTHYTEEQAKKIWEETPGNAQKPLPSKGNGKPDYADRSYPVPTRFGNPIPYRDGEAPQDCHKCIALQVTGADCVNLAKVPFTIALAASMVVAVGMVVLPLYLCAAELVVLLDDQDFMGNLTLLRDDIRGALLDVGYVVSDLEPESANANTTMTFSELMQSSESVINAMNDSILTLLLMLMMLGTREGRTPEQVEREKRNPHAMTILERIEASIRNYILLKTLLSLLTAAMVGLVMALIGVRLFKVWSVLTFILNFIPNVGSMLAIVLPLPIIAVDADLSTMGKIAGFCIPGLIQAYVGNVLEPTLFGKSLNLTAISVFVGLVLWASVWGIPGAVLSVPLLGATKIVLDQTDYPLAKRVLHLMREDNTIEELIEAPGFNKTEDFLKAHNKAAADAIAPVSAGHLHDRQGLHNGGGFNWVQQADGGYRSRMQTNAPVAQIYQEAEKTTHLHGVPHSGSNGATTTNPIGACTFNCSNSVVVC